MLKKNKQAESTQEANLRQILSSMYEDEPEDYSKRIKRLNLQASSIFTKENAIKLFTLLILCNCAWIFTQYYISLRDLRPQIVSNNGFYIIISVMAPFILWIISTDVTYWQFHNRKIALFSIAVVNAVLTVTQPIYTLFWNIVVRLFFDIKTDEAFTKGMIIMLCQVMIFAGEAIIIFIIWHNLAPIFFDEMLLLRLKRFKLSHYVDTRKGKEYKYDLKIIKNLETAADIIIKECDRLVHMFINGASGTGKTSSIFEPAIANDMDKKLQNRKLRQDELLKMLLRKEAYYNAPTTDFQEYRVIPYEKYKKKHQDIYKKYPDCGMTVMAPNNAIIDDVIRLAEARNTIVYILDPAQTYNSPYVREVNINPFYIPLGLSERDRLIHINDAATIFAEVLIAVNEGSKTPDPYFSDISKSVTMNIATICMLARNIEGRQTNITEIQDCIVNFKELEKYIKIVENFYNMKVDYTESKAKKDNVEGLKDKISVGKKDKKTNSEKKKEKNPYYYTIYSIKSELLGEGAEKLFDQSRGLRNLMDKILRDTRFREILCASDDERFDFDKSLAECQIVLVNTALELGSEKSTTFGLFYLLTQKASIFRRPKEYRPLHFDWVDELSQYLHPSLEDMITLYRQFGVGVTFALQSRAQMHKNAMTKYLDGVFDGAGTHIVFGRLSPEDMKKYSDMAGKSKQESVQKTISGNSVLAEDPTENWSVRTSMQLESNLEGTDMRYMDFQEITIMTTDRGRSLNATFGKVFFLKKSDFAKRKEKKLNWSMVQKNINVEKVQEPEQEEERKPQISSIATPENVEVKMSTTYMDADLEKEEATKEEVSESRNKDTESVTQVKTCDASASQTEKGAIKRLDILLFDMEESTDDNSEELDETEINKRLASLNHRERK